MQKPTVPIDFPTYDGYQAAPVKPFEVTVVKEDTVLVSWYSALLQNLDMRQGDFTIFDLNTEFTISYGSKIYLEIYFDTNTNPVASRIRFDYRWSNSQTVKNNADGSKSNVNTYPNELEIISSADITQKLQEMENDVTSADAETNLTVANLNARMASGALSQKEGQLRLSQANDVNTKYKKAIGDLKNSLNKFFTTGNSSSKKLLRLYKLIAYTTKDTASNLDSITISPNATKKLPSFQLVQCLHTDLMFMDYCYKNIPAKILIPWTRPVYQFLIQGEQEDATNTKVPA